MQSATDGRRDGRMDGGTEGRTEGRRDGGRDGRTDRPREWLIKSRAGDLKGLGEKIFRYIVLQVSKTLVN